MCSYRKSVIKSTINITTQSDYLVIASLNSYCNTFLIKPLIEQTHFPQNKSVLVNSHFVYNLAFHTTTAIFWYQVKKLKSDGKTLYRTPNTFDTLITL